MLDSDSIVICEKCAIVIYKDQCKVNKKVSYPIQDQNKKIFSDEITQDLLQAFIERKT